MACYVLLFVALNYWQVGRQEDLNANFDNTRAIRREFEQPRGPIETIDRVVAARSVPNPPGSEFEYQREYPTGELYAHLTGYYTFAFGSTGLERTQNAVLTGSTGEQRLRNLTGIITGADASGTVRMTVRDDLQQVARDALGEREGSVVVIEPSTGAVQAMWSFPSYDPNLIADQDFEAARAVLTFYNASPGDPLLGNAYQQRYMPGSTFKILTTSIGLQNGVLDLQTTFPDESSWVPPQTDNPIENFEGTTCGGDLTEVFTRSCNIPFAKTAVELGPEAMIDGVGEWGVGETLPIDLPRPAASTFGDTRDLDQRLPLLAMRGFGGNEVQMVPLHMAMVAGGGGQRGRDDEAVRGRQHLRPLRAGPRPHRARGLEDPDLAADREHPQHVDAERGHQRHGELLHRPRGRHPGRRQDRDRPAQPARRARAVARVDRRLRAGRRPAVRGGGDARGHQRRDLGEHRRSAGRPDRQDRARRRPARWRLTCSPNCRLGSTGSGRLRTTERPQRASAAAWVASAGDPGRAAR